MTRGGTAHRELDPPTLVIEVPSEVCLQPNLIGAITPLRIPFHSNSLLNKWCWYKLGIYPRKKEIRTMFFTLYKNELQGDQRH